MSMQKTGNAINTGWRVSLVLTINSGFPPGPNNDLISVRFGI
jgi:hypothetical protein